MYYNNYLEDISGEIVKKYVRKIKSYKRHYYISLMFNIALLVFLIITIIFGNTYVNDINRKLNDANTELKILSKQKSNYEEIGKILLSLESKPLNEENFYECCNRIGVFYPDILFAQARLETGNFSDSFLMQNNNLFSMKKATIRPNLQTTSKNNYGVYFSWEHALIDRLLWDNTRWRGEIPNIDEYFDTMQRIYAEDEMYIRKIKSMMN